jgi:hypothetical protein
MKDLINRYTNNRRASKNNPVYSNLRKEIKKLADQDNLSLIDKTKLIELTTKLRKTPSVIRTMDTGTRVYYNRYADD